MRGADLLSQLHVTRHKQRRKFRMPRRDNFEQREFSSSKERNEFALAMRAVKRGVVKYSTQRDAKMIFICAWPIRSAN
jgi:hypothetical protein